MCIVLAGTWFHVLMGTSKTRLGGSETMRATKYSSGYPCGPVSQSACRVAGLAGIGEEVGHRSHIVAVKRINI